MATAATKPAVLTPAQLLNLALETINRRVTARTAGGEGVGTTITIVDAAASADKSKDVTISLAEFEARIVRAAAIMYAESGGNPAAVCYNYTKPDGKPSCSATPLPPGTPGTERGVDRGLCQFNSKTTFTAPDGTKVVVTDAMAFEPQTACDVMYRLSSGFVNFGPWSKSKGMDPSSTQYKTIAAQWESMTGRAVEEIPFTPIDVAPIANAFGNALGWTEALGKFLSVLISPAFWYRLGMGAAGVVVLALSVVYLARGAVTSTLKGALKS